MHMLMHLWRHPKPLLLDYTLFFTAQRCNQMLKDALFQIHRFLYNFHMYNFQWNQIRLDLKAMSFLLPLRP